MCQKASVTFIGWLHRNEHTQSGTEWTFIFEWTVSDSRPYVIHTVRGDVPADLLQVYQNDPD